MLFAQFERNRIPPRNLRQGCKKRGIEYSHLGNIGTNDVARYAYPAQRDRTMQGGEPRNALDLLLRSLAEQARFRQAQAAMHHAMGHGPYMLEAMSAHEILELAGIAIMAGIETFTCRFRQHFLITGKGPQPNR